MSGSRLVYSTDGPRDCSRCGKPLRKCRCAEEKNEAAPAGGVRIQRQRQGRAGKDVTVVLGLELDQENLKRLAKSLKAQCGAGGSVKNGTIEIQGDHRERVREALTSAGYDCKIAGG